MIGSVSSVSFKANAPMDPISRPGAYTRPDSAPVNAAPKKKGKFLKALAATVAAAVVVAGGLVYGAKNGKWFKQVDNLADAKMMEKAKHYLAVAGNKIDEKVWTPLVLAVEKLKPAKSKDAAAGVAAEAAEAAAKA